VIKDATREVEVFSSTQFYNVKDAALRLGVEESSVRRIAINMNAEGIKVGRKFNERGWIFTEADLVTMSKREDRRGKWQQGGGRRRYLSEKMYRDESAGRQPTA
jgi:hypothetical protein